MERVRNTARRLKKYQDVFEVVDAQLWSLVKSGDCVLLPRW
jgi:hypothetical protein